MTKGHVTMDGAASHDEGVSLCRNTENKAQELHPLWQRDGWFVSDKQFRVLYGFEVLLLKARKRSKRNVLKWFFCLPPQGMRNWKLNKVILKGKIVGYFVCVLSQIWSEIFKGFCLCNQSREQKINFFLNACLMLSPSWMHTTTQGTGCSFPALQEHLGTLDMDHIFTGVCSADRKITQLPISFHGRESLKYCKPEAAR